MKVNWIPVGERLPDRHRAVYVYIPGHPVCVLRCYGNVWGQGDFPVTHWAEIEYPEPPEHELPVSIEIIGNVAASSMQWGVDGPIYANLKINWVDQIHPMLPNELSNKLVKVTIEEIDA